MVDYDSSEPWTRVSPQDYEANVREMIRLAAAQGARVVLVDNEFWQASPYRSLLQKIARETGAPFVDSLSIVTDARSGVERNLESRLDLAGSPITCPRPPAGSTTVVFRAFHGTVAVPKTLSIVGADPQAARGLQTRSRCTTMAAKGISGQATGCGALPPRSNLEDGFLHLHEQWHGRAVERP